MQKKFILAALAGGFIVFIWSSISHTVLPIGTAGLSYLENETVVLETLKSAVPQDGLYFFPGIDFSRELTPGMQKEWETKLRTGPHGLLLYHPEGTEPMAASQLLIELLSTLLAAFVVAFLLLKMTGSFWSRVISVAVLGLFAWFCINVSYWNWYGFPGSFVIAEGIDQVVGWFLAGLAMARLLKPAQESAAAA